jgi:hypothetical protein
MVIKISMANSLWVSADTPLENCTQPRCPNIIYVGAETQVVECLIVEVDVGHKPLLKTRESLLLLRQYDEAIGGILRSVSRWRG